MKCPITFFKKKPRKEMTEYEAILFTLNRWKEGYQHKVKSGDTITVTWKIDIK
jgi:hypothetical protein